jgi:hypothetical protein
MMTSVTGTPTPSVPPIIKAIAESKFPSDCNVRPDMAVAPSSYPVEQLKSAWLKKG